MEAELPQGGLYPAWQSAISPDQRRDYVTWSYQKRRKVVAYSGSGFQRMDTEATNTLPIVVCPGCGERMGPNGSVPVTRELDDITYVCPKCGAETTRTLKRA
jgi:hypothetical protein